MRLNEAARAMHDATITHAAEDAATNRAKDCTGARRYTDDADATTTMDATDASGDATTTIDANVNAEHKTTADLGAAYKRRVHVVLISTRDVAAQVDIRQSD